MAMSSLLLKGHVIHLNPNILSPSSGIQDVCLKSYVGLCPT